MGKIQYWIGYLRGFVLGRRLAKTLVRNCKLCEWTDEDDIEEFVRGVFWQIENKRFWIPSKFGEENAK